MPSTVSRTAKLHVMSVAPGPPPDCSVSRPGATTNTTPIAALSPANTPTMNLGPIMRIGSQGWRACNASPVPHPPFR